MLISVSQSRAEADHAHTAFRQVEVSQFRQLPGIITEGLRWSPIVWAGGYRRQNNFLSASLFVLDFDDGQLSLEAAVEHFTAEKVQFLIGTTRSHRIPKGSAPAQDRYRVVLQAATPMTDLRVYKQNMRRILSAYPADQACCDGARVYRPCVEIVAYENGDLIPVLPYEPPPRPNRLTPRDTGILPRWVHEVLAVDCPGRRNSTAFRVVAKLREYGFDRGKITDIMRNSAISLPSAEMEAVIDSGWRAGESP